MTSTKDSITLAYLITLINRMSILIVNLNLFVFINKNNKNCQLKVLSLKVYHTAIMDDLTIRGMALIYAVFFIFLMTYLSSRKLVSILTIFFLSRQMRRCADPAKSDIVAPFFIASSLMSFF